MRSAMFLRIAASSANARRRERRGARSTGRRRHARIGSWRAFRSRAPGAVSQRLSGGRRLTRVRPWLRSSRIGADGSANKRSKPSVMRPSPRSARRAAARTGAAAARRPGRARARAASITRGERGDVGEAEVEALAGERMDDVGGVAEQDPARPAPAAGAGRRRSGQAARSRRRARARRRRRRWRRRARCSKPPASHRQQRRRRARRQRPDQGVRAPGSGRSNGSSASTSGERNHWRATWRCGRVATSRAAIARWP